jgi:LysR family transcriptional activator of nhaA
MDWLNYHHLLNFWLVAREGSVQRASEVLHVTPASVSVQIRQLERSLGVRLFKKQGRGLALTEMGEQVAEYASDIFATGQELLEMVRGRPVGRPLELRVGIRDVMPKLVAFQLLEPAFGFSDAIRVVCHEGEMSSLIADLSIHKLDLVLSDTALDPLYKVQASSHLLGESDIVILGAAKLARKYRKGFPASLDGAPFLLPTENNVLRREMDQWFRDLDVSPQVLGEFTDSAMLKIAGGRGLGLFAIPVIIEEEVAAMYRVQNVGKATGVRERFYAVSVPRKLPHPAVVAIRARAASDPGAR